MPINPINVPIRNRRAAEQDLLQSGATIGAQAHQNSEDNKLRELLQSRQLQAKADADALELPFKESDREYKNRMAGVAEKNASTMAGFREAQDAHYQEQEKIAKLKTLFGGGAMGPNGKPLSSEAQKASNLVDSTRSAINNTEKLALESPKTAAAHGVISKVPFVGNHLATGLAGFLGGDLKKIDDSIGIARESIQNVKTGAAATGHQAASFQSWNSPGVLDVLRGQPGAGFDQVKDDLNTMQQGLKRQAPAMNEDMLEAAGLSDDPLAQEALRQQQLVRQQQIDEKRKSVTPEHMQLYQEIQANPGHPGAQNAMQDLVRRYGDIF